MLLQVWRAIGEGDQLLPPGSRACRWRVPFSHEVISTNVGVIFRDQFDHIVEGEFIWEPYRTEDDIMTSFPSYCTVGRDIWMARVPLICFDIIDWHLPDRVLRQFGRVQSVPDRFDAHLAMHFRDRRGKMAIDWAKEYQTFIGEWNNRRNTIVHAERSNEMLTSSDPYMLWFRRHTRLVLSNPSDIAAFGYQGVGDSLEGLVRRVARAYHMADAAHITRDAREKSDAIVEIRELLYDGLQQAHRRDRLDFGHFGEDPYMGVDIIVTSMPHPNMPSTEPSTSMPSTSMPPPHRTARHAHQSDYFDMEHFGEGPSMGLSPHGPSTAMHTPQTSPPECTYYTSQFAPEVDPLMSEHTSTHHGHILDTSWSPPPYRTAVGTPVTSLAPLSTTCLSTMIPSASTFTAPNPFTVPSSPTPPSSLTPHITFTYHVDPLITRDFHIDGEGEGQVHAPTRGTGRGKGRWRGRRRRQAIDHDNNAADDGVSQLSAVCEGVPEVVSNDCTTAIGDVQPASTEAGEGVIRAAAQDILRVYSKRPRRQTHGRGWVAGCWLLVACCFFILVAAGSVLLLLGSSSELIIGNETVDKQAEKLRNISSRYEHDKKFWVAAVNNLEEKIKVMKEEHSQLSHEAHECSDSIPEMNKMVFAVQSLVAQCEDLKVKYSEEQRKRRKLYNEVQEAKGNIRVFCRCRPSSKAEVTAEHETVVDFDAAKDGELGILSGGSTKKTFKFDRVYTPKDDQGEGTTFEGALDWLCLNLPGNELPLKFSTGTSLYTNEGGAVSIISTARDDWSPVVDSSDKIEEETPKISVRIKGRSDDDTLNSFQRSQADWIRQYVEQQEEDASESWEDDAVDEKVEIVPKPRVSNDSLISALGLSDEILASGHDSSSFSASDDAFHSFIPSKHPETVALCNEEGDMASVLPAVESKGIGEALEEESGDVELGSFFLGDVLQGDVLPPEVVEIRKKEKMRELASGKNLEKLEGIWKKGDPQRIPKAVLQQLCQKSGWEAPKYNKVLGKENNSSYAISILRKASGRGKSRKAGGLVTLQLPSQDETSESAEND
ncbi:unnamed protein product [Camellia sinensis]